VKFKIATIVMFAAGLTAFAAPGYTNSVYSKTNIDSMLLTQSNNIYASLTNNVAAVNVTISNLNLSVSNLNWLTTNAALSTNMAIIRPSASAGIYTTNTLLMTNGVLRGIQ
jgi:hypothetical protein